MSILLMISYLMTIHLMSSLIVLLQKNTCYPIVWHQMIRHRTI